MNNPCDCKQDGYCPRYGKEMNGRFREICAGINCDLGTAAAFRQQWLQEKQTQPLQLSLEPPIPLLLTQDQAPGDAVAMTAAIYSLHTRYPGKYQTSVESYWPEVFDHNPHVHQHYIPTAAPTQIPNIGIVKMHYPAVGQSNERGIHFMQAWCEHLSESLGVPIPLMANRPHLYFPPTDIVPTGDYWIVCSGGKRDFTNKLWGYHNYQSVVDQLKGKVRFIQVGGSKPTIPWNKEHAIAQVDDHPLLNGVHNVVGQTSLRSLFNLVRYSRGVLCGVSLLMHVAAALEKPAVVIAGGREPVQWNSYPMQQYMHTVGMLPCIDNQGKSNGGCWRARVVQLNDGSAHDNNLCQRPVTLLQGRVVPECMTLLSSRDVAEKVLCYNQQYE